MLVGSGARPASVDKEGEEEKAGVPDGVGRGGGGRPGPRQGARGRQEAGERGGPAGKVGEPPAGSGLGGEAGDLQKARPLST